MNYSQTQSGQKGIPQCIIFNFVVVAAAVNFQNKFFFGTVKINYVIADNLLPIKIQSKKLLVFQMVPEQSFGQIACFA